MVMPALVRPASSEPLVCVRNLSKEYRQRKPLSTRWVSVHALENVDLTISEGANLAIVGESGAGKSTLARCLALLETPGGGEIWFKGRNVTRLGRQDRRALHRSVQLIFQDSASALNPRMTAAEIIAEPLLIQRVGTKAERRIRALEMMDRVGLSSDWGEKRPLEFSGGQRQRLAIARALVLQPSLLILDEALSGLDPLNQKLILELLAGLQNASPLTCVLICHDLGLASRFADEVAVMHRGRIVECKPSTELFAHPEHPYSRALLAAMPPLESVVQQRGA
jgi:ABC-type glutathione transport system ATPase component